MIVIGTDTHKQSHTAAALDEGTGRVIADQTVRAKRRDPVPHLGAARTCAAQARALAERRRGPVATGSAARATGWSGGWKRWSGSCKR